MTRRRLDANPTNGGGGVCELAIADPCADAMTGFEYQGLRFSQDTLFVFAGPCAIESRETTAEIFGHLQRLRVKTTRAGVFKPRTSPYAFQGLGEDCLPYLFELAGKHGIRVIAIEVTREVHVDLIQQALERAGRSTGVMLQIGTRNAQNFGLLQRVGEQHELPVLFKRGMGITLDESLNACEYIASQGNRKIIFCLRGMKSLAGAPHRNLVDFGHVPVIKRLTHLPVGIDPSHSVGTLEQAPDGLSDIHHVTAQGVIAGANVVLVEFHPRPPEALCDGHQALSLDQLEHYLADIRLVRQSYKQRLRMAPMPPRD